MYVVKSVEMFHQVGVSGAGGAVVHDGRGGVPVVVLARLPAHLPLHVGGLRLVRHRLLLLRHLVHVYGEFFII
jgi:hypothetical protein